MSPNHHSKQLYFEATKKLFERSYYDFYKNAYRVLLPDENFSDNWHIEYLCKVLQEEAFRIKDNKKKKKDIIINMPFRSSKSLITTVIFPIWVWTCVKSSMKFICVSFSSSLALEHAQLSRDLLDSEWYRTLYGENKVKLREDANTKGYFVNNAGGFRKSIGIGGQITGSGADIIIFDDPQDPKKADSEVERENTIFSYTKTLYSRLNNPVVGVRVVVQQRLHQRDLTGYLMSNLPQRHSLIKIPAKITEKTTPIPQELSSYYQDGLFWKDRFSEDVIEDFTKTLGSFHASGQLQQEPAPESGGIIRREWFDIISPLDLERDMYKEPIHFFIDSSDIKDGDYKNNDPTAILACFLKNNTIYVVDVVTVKKPFFELCNYINKYVVMNYYTNYSKIYIEPKSSGRSIVSQLRATTKLNIVELPSPKDSKLQRVMSIQPLLEGKRVKLIQGNYIEDFLDELTIFDKGEHDDMVDTLTYAVQTLLGDDGGFVFDFI